MSAEAMIPIALTSLNLRAVQQVTAAGTGETEVVTLADLNVSVLGAISVTGTSAAIIAQLVATAAIRHIVISVPTSADSGIYVNVGATATSSHFLVEAGGALKLNTPQAIHAIRAGSSNVTAYILTGVPT